MYKYVVTLASGEWPLIEVDVFANGRASAERRAISRAEYLWEDRAFVIGSTRKAN